MSTERPLAVVAGQFTWGRHARPRRETGGRLGHPKQADTRAVDVSEVVGCALVGSVAHEAELNWVRPVAPDFGQRGQ